MKGFIEVTRLIKHFPYTKEEGYNEVRTVMPVLGMMFYAMPLKDFTEPVTYIEYPADSSENASSFMVKEPYEGIKNLIYESYEKQL